MQVLSVSRVIAYGCPVRLFTVTVRHGERTATVSADGVARTFRYRAKGWRPGSQRVLEELIQAFLAQEQSGQIAAANAELARRALAPTVRRGGMPTCSSCPWETELRKRSQDAPAETN